MRILCFLLLLLPGLAGAEVYRWVDENGVVHYGDRPSGNAQPADLPELQRMDGAPSVETVDEEEEPIPAAEGPRIRILQPRPDQTFRDARGLVPVAVSLSPKLTSTQRLIYYLDGSPAAGPTNQTSTRLEGVIRGEHRLSVAVLAGEEELSRSESVTFHMKPPSALSPTGNSKGSAPTAPPSGNSQGAPRPGGGAP